MENFISGKIYKTILNTKNKEFNKNPLNTAAYDYSVTKITSAGAIFLTYITAIFSSLSFFFSFKRYIFLNREGSYMLM